MKEVKITIPDNCELIKKGNSYIIKEKSFPYPKTWEEFCKQNPHSYDEYYIDQASKLVCQPFSFDRDPEIDKKWCTSKEEAEAFLALMQLRQLRKAWVGNWKPTYDKINGAIRVSLKNETLYVDSMYIYNNVLLTFPTKEMAQEFFDCFRDLCEQAKPLL